MTAQGTSGADAAPFAFTMVGDAGMSCEGDSCAIPAAAGVPAAVVPAAVVAPAAVVSAE
ncbi:hypothetical protein ACEXQD_11530 [Herbiconiux sp. P15]|uniref:hypothetical protein n=1 Tax=Herbiconiux liukaitaii TaxID=3342799 RepID=UPI0035B84570